MAIPLPDARELSDEVLEALRLRALRGCQLGFTEVQIAEILGIARETVSRWWSAYADHGVQALPHRRTGRPLGSGRVLTDPQAEHIRQQLRTHQPEELGIAAPLWTRRAVRDLIRREYNACLALRTVGRYLQRWGFTAKRPRRHSRDQDPEEVQQWLEETYPAIAARAQREGAEIHWGDEVGVAADQLPARGYAPQGAAAAVDVPDRHVRANQISTIELAINLSPCLLFAGHLTKPGEEKFRELKKHCDDLRTSATSYLRVTNYQDLMSDMVEKELAGRQEEGRTSPQATDDNG